MAKIELSIKDTYVPTWGVWECVREIIQNGLDEDQKGHKLTVKHRNGWLTVYNHSAQLETNALLMGETDKADNPELIGEHGDGLDVGLLAGIRSGLEIKITTQTQSWIPYIGHSDIYKSNVLCIKTRQLKKKLDGTTVAIKIDKEAWETLTKHFIRFANIDPEKTIHVKDTGTLILDPEYQGNVFAKGIYVQHIQDLKYGYDLRHVKVDRDRRVIENWDLKYRLAEMFRQALASNPTATSPIIYESLRDGNPDTDGLEYYTSSSISDAVAEQFKKEQGDNAIPVTSIGESSTLTHLNKRGVVVNTVFSKVLSNSTKIQNAYQVQAEYNESTLKAYSWHDLTDEERANLTEAAALLDAVVPGVSSEKQYVPVLDRVNIADFAKSDLLGRQLDGNKILIAKKILADKQETLLTLVHEEAHRISDSEDGTAGHVEVLQDLWSALFWNR